MLHYLTTDPQVLGIVGWGSAVITFLGFAVALFQLSKVKTAAIAAQKAVAEVIRTVRTREQIVELTSAMTHLANAQSSIARRNAELGIVHLGLVKSSLIRVHELQIRHGVSQGDYEELVEGLGQLVGELQSHLDTGANYNSLLMLTELRGIADGIEADAARLRYQDERDGE